MVSYLGLSRIDASCFLYYIENTINLFYFKEKVLTDNIFGFYLFIEDNIILIEKLSIIHFP